MLSVDNMIRNNHFYYKDKFFKIKVWEIAKQLLSNFNLENVNLLSNPNVNT